MASESPAKESVASANKGQVFCGLALPPPCAVIKPTAPIESPPSASSSSEGSAASAAPAVPATALASRPTTPPAQPDEAPAGPSSNTARPTATRSNRKQKARRYNLKCRYGCTSPLADEGTLRSHMRKVHNLFDEGAQTWTCAGCSKLFATEKEWHRHRYETKEGCWPSTQHPLWDVQRPQTQQERADTWAYSKDGPISAHLVVWLEGEGAAVEQEGPLSTSAPPSSPTAGKRKRTESPADDREGALAPPSKDMERMDSGLGDQQQPAPDCFAPGAGIRDVTSWEDGLDEAINSWLEMREAEKGDSKENPVEID